MNELDLLTRLRDEVPLTDPSPGAQRAFRDGLTGAAGTSRSRRPRHGARFSLGRSSMLAGATALAFGVTAGIVVLALPSGRQPSTASATGATGAGAAPAPQRSQPDPAEPRARSPAATRSAQLLADVAANRVLWHRASTASHQCLRENQCCRRALRLVQAKLKWQTVTTWRHLVVGDRALFSSVSDSSEH